MGLTPEDYPEPQVNVWPENWPSIQLFLRYQTQWRVGGRGPFGLDYNPILHDLDRRNLSADEYDDMLEAIRMIEAVALEEMSKD